jgi:hypothetical protein
VGRQDDFDILQFGSFVTGISPFVFCLRSARPPLRMETRTAIPGKNKATGTNPSVGLRVGLQDTKLRLGF